MAAINGKGMYRYDSVYFTTVTFENKVHHFVYLSLDYLKDVMFNIRTFTA